MWHATWFANVWGPDSAPGTQDAPPPPPRWEVDIPINSTALHWLGSNHVMPAADFMHISDGLPTAPFPLVPIPTVSLCLRRVVGCPVVGSAHAMPRPARPLPPFPSLPMGVSVRGGGGCVGWPGLVSGCAVCQVLTLFLRRSKLASRARVVFKTHCPF